MVASPVRDTPSRGECGEGEARRELVRHALNDLQGSIHANDSKSSAGLVVHGLLATAVLTLVSRLGPVYGDATDVARAAVVLCLLAALLTAVASILCLLAAVKPYPPSKVVKRLRGRYAASSSPMSRRCDR